MKVKLSHKSQPRKRLLRNMLSSLILFESITTTSAKAKALKSEAQSFISKLNKETDAFNLKRMIAANLYGGAKQKAYDMKNDFETVKSYKIDERFGDGAPRMIVKLIIKEKATVAPANIKEKKSKR